jgi:Mn2+/Fe2+ NRAMP family transporter
VDLANVVAEFAGVAAAMQIFGISKYVAVPIAAMLVWILVIRGTYRQVEIIFLFACVLYLSYVFSAILAKPDWLIAAKHTVIPNLQFNSGYLIMLTGLGGVLRLRLDGKRLDGRGAIIHVFVRRDWRDA